MTLEKPTKKIYCYECSKSGVGSELVRSHTPEKLEEKWECPVHGEVDSGFSFSG